MWTEILKFFSPHYLVQNKVLPYLVVRWDGTVRENVLVSATNRKIIK